MSEHGGTVTQQITDEMVDRFKAAWHKADSEGREGERVRDGLMAAMGLTPPEPDDAPGSLPDRLRQIADDLMYGRTASTHSDACWQWHESCALHRAADLLSGDGEERP